MLTFATALSSPTSPQPSGVVLPSFDRSSSSPLSVSVLFPNTFLTKCNVFSLGVVTPTGPIEYPTRDPTSDSSRLPKLPELRDGKDVEGVDGICELPSLDSRSDSDSPFEKVHRDILLLATFIGGRKCPTGEEVSRTGVHVRRPMGEGEWRILQGGLNGEILGLILSCLVWAAMGFATWRELSPWIPRAHLTKSFGCADTLGMRVGALSFTRETGILLPLPVLAISTFELSTGGAEYLVAFNPSVGVRARL